MEFQVLGPLAVCADGVTKGVRGYRQRAVLAALVLNANQVTTVDHLISVAWEEPPQSADVNVRTYVMALRRLLNDLGGQDQRLVTRPRGYLLWADREEIDLAVYEDLVARGERSIAEGNAAAGVDHLHRACQMWRGQPLEDVALAGPLRADVERLAERRLAVTERCVSARLGLGRHVELVDELRSLVLEHPYRERLWEQLLLALYRSGRQAEALAAYDRVRRELADELGIDPNPELQRLHQQILRADPTLQLTPESVLGTARLQSSLPIPHQLPSGIPAFTGRAAQLAELHALLPAEDADSGEATIVAGIDGGAGVGKTALAIHFAHQVTDRFPDGQLYVNLRGYDPEQQPLPAGEALGQFLRALGVDPACIPTRLDEQAALYRTVAAGKRLLVVLDNAAGSDQVRPLLPGGPAYLIIVTSRNRLAGLVARDGAHRITLDVLSGDEAKDLLARVIGTERIAADPDTAAELAQLCGHLPLALRIAAERAATHPQTKLADLVGGLADERERLDLLTAGDDDTVAVRAVFGWTYSRLQAPAAQLFRLLGLHTGPDIAAPAAAALADTSTARARRLLGYLVDVHLLEGATWGRYRMHDLIRLYAREQAAITETDVVCGAAVRRLLNWYLQTADAADRTIMPHRPRVPLDPPEQTCVPLIFESRHQALQWCETERENLVLATRQAAEAGHSVVAWKLPIALWGFFKLRKHWTDSITAHQIGLAAAQNTGDQCGQQWISGSLGLAYGELRQFNKAIDHLQRALALSHDLGDLLGQAVALTGLGLTLREFQHAADAIGHLQHALADYRKIDNPWGEAVALTGLGLTHCDLNQSLDAVDCIQRALAIYRRIDDPWGQAWSLHSLGDAYRALRRFPYAIDCYQQALCVRRRIGDQAGEGWTLYHLGIAQYETQRIDAAYVSWGHALSILENLGHPCVTEVRSYSQARTQQNVLGKSGHVSEGRIPC